MNGFYSHLVCFDLINQFFWLKTYINLIKFWQKFPKCTTGVQIKNENALAFEAFDALEKEEKSIISKDVLKNKSTEINKRIALYHLLTKDWDFIEQIADEIKTTSLSLITDSSMNLVLLYECQENPEVCSAQSRKMLSMCVFNEDHCKLISYEEYLQRTHTVNEVNDYYNILAAIRKILNIQ